MRPRYAGRFISGGSYVAHADDAVQGDSSPTGVVPEWTREVPGEVKAA